jgi:hypothetical protein
VVDGKGNEITALAPLLGRIGITGGGTVLNATGTSGHPHRARLSSAQVGFPPREWSRRCSPRWRSPGRSSLHLTVRMCVGASGWSDSTLDRRYWLSWKRSVGLLAAP